MNTKSLDQIKDQYYGIPGTFERDTLERELEALRIGYQIKTTREKLGLTQTQLAERIGKKREFISRIENDGENITLRTLYEVIECGLGGRLKITLAT